MRPRFASPSAAPPAAVLEEGDLASLRQQHFAAFCILLSCAILFICATALRERDRKEEQ